MTSIILPNDFLEALEKFEQSGKDVLKFIQFQYPKPNAPAYLNIRFFINNRIFNLPSKFIYRILSLFELPLARCNCILKLFNKC